MAVVAIAVAGFFYRSIYVVSLMAAGRGPDCSMGEALKSYDEHERQVAAKDEIVRGSGKVREEGAFALWHTPRGDYWIPSQSSGALFWDLAEQQRKIYGTGDAAVRSGDVVLDCGANIGVYTREALNSGARLVVAIEPAPENVECLRRTFAPEIEAKRVVVYPKGVWDKDDVLTLNVDPGNSAADSFLMQPQGSKPSVQVPLTTIDKLAAELNLDRVDYIKMDIEGAEQRALFGAQKTMAQYKPRLAISVYHLPEDPKKIPVIIRAANPGYLMECGPCSLTGRRILPNVFNFR